MVDQAVSNPAPSGVGVAIVNYKNEYVDVTPLLLEFNIYEDIFEHVMTCDISLKDLTSVPEVLPIVGDETIVIKYNTGIGSDQYILKFKCYKMNNRTPFSETEHVYSLHGVSDELYMDMFTSADKFFVGETASSIAQSVFDEYLSGGGKSIEVEESTNLMTITSAGHSPFELINLVSSEAQAAKYQDASFYVFYETHKGFYFKSLNSLLEGEPVEKYHLADPSGPSANEQDAASIKRYQMITGVSFDDSFNMLKQITGGGMDNNVGFIDPITKTYKEMSFSYTNKEDFSKLTFSKNAGKPVVSDAGPLAEKISGKTSSGHSRLIPTDWNYAESDFGDIQDFNQLITEGTDPHKFHGSKKFNFYQNSIAMVNSLNDYVVNLVLPGNSKLTAGDIIEVYLPSNSPADAGKYMKHFGAKPEFLITSLNHRYKGDTGNVVTVVRAVKQSFGKGI